MNGRESDDPIGSAVERLEAGAPGQALALLEPLVKAGRAGPYAQLLYGRALTEAGRPDAAIAVLRELAMLSPSSGAIALALGAAFLAREALPLAIPEFQRTLRLEPENAAAHWGLARAWAAAGEAEKAAPHLEAAHGAASPDDMAALRRRLSEMTARTRSDAGYVRHLFDQFSLDYDRKMRSELGYAVPEILKQLAVLQLAGRRAPRLLDLGCGTGLAGAAFAPLARVIDGVDLSPGMIAKARATGIYADLKVADLETFLNAAERRYDVAVAADVLVYLGGLDAVFAGVRRVLTDGGLFLFTVERGEGAPFALGPKRRWRHSEDYVRALADAQGFDVAGLIACTPRFEAGEPIDGLAAVLRAL